MPSTKQTSDEKDYNPAHNIGQDEFDKIVEKNFSDGDEKMTEERARRGQDETANSLADMENEATRQSQAENDSREAVEQREQDGDSLWENNTTPTNSRSRFSLKVTRNKTIAGGIFGVLFVVFGLFLSFGPSTAIVHLKEVLFDKFDGQFSSYMERRNTRLFAKKISKDFTTGCTIKIKCRYRGMTRLEVNKFEKRNPGAKIVTEGRAISGKLKVKGIQFIDDDGKQRFVTSSQFRAKLTTSSSLRNTVRNYNKPTVAHWRDVSAGKFYSKFKIYRGKLKPAGDAESKASGDADKRKIRVRELVRNSVAGKFYDSVHANQSGITEEAAEDAIKDEISNEINQQAQHLAEDFDDPTKAIDQTPKPSGSIIKNTGSTIAKAGVESVKGAFLGPISGANKACAAKRIIASVGYVAKFINARKLIAYSMIFMVAADQIKAGDADGDTAQQIGDLGSILTTPDPETGNTYSDSFGYQYAAENKLIQDPETKQIDTGQIYPYVVGAGLTGSLLSITDKLDEIPGIKTGCKLLDNMALQIVGGVLSLGSVLLGFGSIGGVAISAAAGGAFAVAELIATPMLARAVAGAIITGDETGQDAGNAITSGFSGASSMNARFHGAFPLSKDKVAAFRNETQKARKQISFDSSRGNYAEKTLTQQFSSSVAAAFIPYTQNNLSLPTMAKLFNLPLQTATTSTRALAANEEKQYELCKDPDYEKLDVAADPYCNPSYSLDPGIGQADEDNPYDADKVIEYMCGTPIDADIGCADGRFIDSEGNSQGDYSDWLEECVYSDQPIIASGENETPKECLDPEETDDPVKYTMFRTYKNDSDIDDQYNDRDAGSEGQEQVESTAGELPSGSVKELAQKIIDSGKVTGAANYMDQIKDLAAGKGGCPVSEKILGLLLVLSEKYSLYISSLNRKCTGVLTASGTGSLHYADGGGRAVDIGMVDGLSMNSMSSDSKVKNKAKQVFVDAIAVIPEGSELGQIESCGLTGIDTKGMEVVTDACNHIHIGIPG